MTGDVGNVAYSRNSHQTGCGVSYRNRRHEGWFFMSVSMIWFAVWAIICYAIIRLVSIAKVKDDDIFWCE